MMEPGFKLDILIAEKVMGAKWITEDDEQPEACPYLVTDDWIFYPKIFIGTPRFSDCGTYTGGMPQYSRHIGAAWEVVTKIGKCSIQAPGSVEIGECYFVADRWTVLFNVNKNLKPSEGDTAPHAICLAALIAMGVE